MYLEACQSYMMEPSTIFARKLHHECLIRSQIRLCINLQSVNPIIPSVHNMVKHTFKIFQHLLQDNWSIFDHLVDTRYYRIKIPSYNPAATMTTPNCPLKCLENILKVTRNHCVKNTARKMSVFRVILVRIFPHSD